jgi:hypothetical protein
MVLFFFANLYTTVDSLPFLVKKLFKITLLFLFVLAFFIAHAYENVL